jgi:uncharacterized protein (TIGR02145 family)
MKLLTIITNLTLIAMLLSCTKDESSKSIDNPIVDYDGNVYTSVTIGTQQWLKEPLKTTRYMNGDLIEIVSDGTSWSNLTTGAYCSYNYDNTKVMTYGRLYNWFVISDNRKVCPTGWHVPTDNELTTLVNFLGGETIAGGKMKESGNVHWVLSNTGTTNSTGLTLLPCGNIGPYGAFNGLGSTLNIWTSTEVDSNNAWERVLYDGNAGAYRYSSAKNSGSSIHCIKD